MTSPWKLARVYSRFACWELGYHGSVVDLTYQANCLGFIPSTMKIGLQAGSDLLKSGTWAGRRLCLFHLA